MVYGHLVLFLNHIHNNILQKYYEVKGLSLKVLDIHVPTYLNMLITQVKKYVEEVLKRYLFLLFFHGPIHIFSTFVFHLVH